MGKTALPIQSEPKVHAGGFKKIKLNKKSSDERLMKIILKKMCLGLF